LEAWILGVMTSIFSSAVWDSLKGIVGLGRDEPISLGLEQPTIEAFSGGLPGPTRRSADLATLERIQQLLPSTETIEYLRVHSFGNAHRGAFLEPLDRFLEQTAGPESQFLSSGRLERLRQEFRTAVQTFQALIGRYTFRHIQEDMYEIPSEWELNGSGLYWKATRELNAAATAVVEKYEEFVSTARRELLQ
jgi:hypothetical protein